MGNRLQRVRRLGVAAAGLFVLGASGCAFPNGTTGGDPVLGNFNRPIVPTPPPEHGGIGLDSPAYDAGSRIGVASPDIPAPVDNAQGGSSLPQLTSPSLFGRARMPFGGNGNEPFLAGKSGPAGARLPSPGDAAPPPMPAPGRTSPDGTPAKYTAAGPGLTPSESPVRPVSYEVIKDPSRVKTMEDGQAVLQAFGARGMKVEQLTGGEWVFGCTVGAKGFEARGKEPMEAMKLVLEQVQDDVPHARRTPR
jgi:hypothetical protein